MISYEDALSIISRQLKNKGKPGDMKKIEAVRSSLPLPPASSKYKGPIPKKHNRPDLSNEDNLKNLARLIRLELKKSN
tara:strand:- start:3559 stop:3792 length:234 start_codon:yes stop_codon:yes gene_type:complete